jgi:release factor glutamine methyltransferase
MSTVGEWLAGTGDLPRLEKELLLGFVLDLDRSRIIAHPERPLSAEERQRLDGTADRLRSGEPLAYITGTREFWSLPLEVTAAVLIPRPDTETLVAAALEVLSNGDEVLDLGTGSGAVAIALARAGSFRVVATDVSAAALEVARRNAGRLGAAVSFLEGSWFAPVRGRFNVIVSNPPYVAAGDPHLVDLGSEPVEALVSGPEGLDDLRHICREAPGYLHPGGWLLLEHGCGQANAVRGLFADAGFVDVETLEDLGGLDRVTRGRQKEAGHD